MLGYSLSAPQGVRQYFFEMGLYVTFYSQCPHILKGFPFIDPSRKVGNY